MKTQIKHMIYNDIQINSIKKLQVQKIQTFI